MTYFFFDSDAARLRLKITLPSSRIRNWINGIVLHLVHGWSYMAKRKLRHWRALDGVHKEQPATVRMDSSFESDEIEQGQSVRLAFYSFLLCVVLPEP